MRGNDGVWVTGSEKTGKEKQNLYCSRDFSFFLDSFIFPVMLRFLFN